MFCVFRCSMTTQYIDDMAIKLFIFSSHRWLLSFVLMLSFDAKPPWFHVRPPKILVSILLCQCVFLLTTVLCRGNTWPKRIFRTPFSRGRSLIVSIAALIAEMDMFSTSFYPLCMKTHSKTRRFLSGSLMIWIRSTRFMPPSP